MWVVTVGGGVGGASVQGCTLGHRGVDTVVCRGWRDAGHACFVVIVSCFISQTL